MAPKPKDMFSDFIKLYNGLNTTNKLVIGSIVTVLLLGFSYLIFFADLTDYDYLYTNIDQADAGEVIAALKEAGVKYQIDNRSIMVQRGKVHELRMKMAAKGLPKTKGIGFEIFDDQKLGTSNFVQQLNYNRALQGELSRSISQMEKVDLARVHLVTPKKTLFKEDETEPTASIVVKLKTGQKLENDEVKSIMHLVSSAVMNLNPKNITVIDSNGSMLSKATGQEDQFWGNSPLEYKGKIEKELGARVEEMVSHVVGVGKVIANVTVELDFKKEEKTEEIFDPDQVVVRSEKRVKEARQNSENSAGGVPGTQANTPQPANAPGGGSQATTSDRARDLINYEINKVVRHTVRQAGDMRRLSVAVLVDGTYEMEDEDGKMVEKYKPRTVEEIRKIRELVKRAVGFDGERSDSIEVVSVPFQTSVLEDEEMERTFLEKYDFLPAMMKYGIIILLAIVMVFALFKPLVEWIISFHEEERLRDIEREQEDVVRGMEEQLVEVRRTIETSTVEYKTRLCELAEQAPDLVAAVLKNWVAAED